MAIGVQTLDIRTKLHSTIGEVESRMAGVQGLLDRQAKANKIDMDAQTELIMCEKREIERQRKVTQKMVLQELKKTQTLDTSSRFEFSRINAMMGQITGTLQLVLEG